MTEQQSTLTTFYNGWNDYQSLLIKALTPLTLDQLGMRTAPQLRSIREIVTHMIGARARWFHDLVGEGDLEFAALGTWDRKGMQARSAAELVNALETTWRVLQTAIVGWTPAEWDQTYEGEPGEPASFIPFRPFIPLWRISTDRPS